MNSIGDRIKEVRKAKGLNQKAFAKLIGLKSAIAISRYERNLRKHNISILVNIAQKCNISLDWLIRGLGDMHKKDGPISLELRKTHDVKIPSDIPLRPVPLINSVPAGYPEKSIDDHVVDYIYIPAEMKDPKAFALMISGDSMNPILNDGDIVVISPSSRIRPNDIGAFRINEDVVLKRLHKEDRKIYLISENKKYGPIILKDGDVVEQIGRAVYQLKKL